MLKLFAVALAALVAVSPSMGWAASGTITCPVDSFDKDGASAKQPLTVTFDGKQATVQSPWGTITYDDALVTGDDVRIAVVLGGQKTARLPDFDGMEACLSKAAPDDLHKFATLLGLVSDCGHTLPLGSAPVSVETLFGFTADASGGTFSMSISYSEDSTVASDYLEFRQKGSCKRL